MDNNKSDAKPMVLLEGQTSGSGVEPADLQGLLKELEKEREFLEQAGSCPRALAYVLREIEKIANKTRDPPPVVDITKDIPIAVSCRVPLPVKEFPKFNFVGKLLGPKGNSLKRLQESTMSRMIVCGRGSMKDKMKEEELRTSEDPKNAHLRCDPYVDIVVRAPPAEAYARLAHALTEIRPFLTPSKNDAISQSQMREMEGLINGVGGGMGMDKGPWGMGAYQPRPAGPMGMKNGPPPAAYGGSGPHNYSAPPGPAGFRPSYPPAPGGGFGGPQYGGGPGYPGGPAGYGAMNNAGYGGGPGGAYGPGAGPAPNPGGYGPGAQAGPAAAANSMGGFGGNQGSAGGMTGGGAHAGGAGAGSGTVGGASSNRGGGAAANGGYYGPGSHAASGGATGGAARSGFAYSDYM